MPLPFVSYEEVAVFKFVIEVTKLAVDCEAVNVFKESNILIICKEPEINPLGRPVNPLNVICDEPDTTPFGNTPPKEDVATAYVTPLLLPTKVWPSCKDAVNVVFV